MNLCILKEQEDLITEFYDKIFNALIDRIEVLESMHFVFVLDDFYVYLEYGK